MPKWCVESYPSSLYKFEKTRFWHFVTISGRGQGGPNPCLVHTCRSMRAPPPAASRQADALLRNCGLRTALTYMLHRATLQCV